MTDELERRIWRLEATQEICELKARYFRSIDTQDWTLFGDVFTEDAVLSLRGLTWNGRNAIVAWASDAMLGGASSHQGHIEPPRDCRRPFSLSYAAMETSSSMA